MSHDLLYRPEDLRRDDAVAAMTGTTFRIYQRPDHGWGAHNDLQMWYRNEWWWVCRTDLIDDVCTGIVEQGWTLDEWIAHYKQKCAKSYGVRPKLNKVDGFPTFAIIDSLSDG